MRHFSAISLLCFLFVFCSADKAFAYEGILSFHSDIRIRTDSSLLVSETILVHTAQQQIRHGIFRDFPLRYKDGKGGRHNLGLRLIGVYRNGQPENYSLKNHGSGKRLFIGTEVQLLPAGQQDYKIIYILRRSIDFSGAQDRLHWNVTGNGWAFPIKEAVLRLYLPEGATLTEYAAATGQTGTEGRNFRTKNDDENGVLTISTTAGLAAGEGVTVSAAWPKGFIVPPAPLEKFTIYVEENIWLFTACVFAGFGILLFFIIWWLVGRDPPHGTIIPKFTPPENFSPALAAYVAGQGSGEATLRRAFCAGIAGLAVNGFIKISLYGRNRYALDLAKPRLHQNRLPAAERVLIKCLFAGRVHRFMFTAQKDIRFEMILSGFANALKRQSNGIYFAGNENYVLASTVFTLLLSVWLFTGMFHGHILLLQGCSLVIGLLFLNLVYYFLMKAPTLRGRWKMDRLEGFKTYMSIAEKDRLDFLQPPDMTVERFETLLPYAVAFGIEEKWAEKFKKSVPRPIYDSYQPHWFVSDLAQMHLPKLCLILGAGMQKVLITAAQLPGQLSAVKIAKKAAMIKAGKGFGGAGGGW